MSTTIDSLQIEIQSNSNNAAQGIDTLAASLEKLKKNGSFKAVSTNLNNLSGALQNLPNVHSASNSLRTLANSIEKLKGVGSVSSISNSLAKLPTALKSLGNINLGNTKTQLEGVANAVSPLSSIKAGGLSTMVNAMRNLGKVSESLDDETIGKFAQKVELLTKKLSPLSEKMATIKTGFNAINSSARSAATSVDNLGDEINATALNMSSFITIIESVVNVLQNLITKMSEYIHMASQWDGIEYQFGNTFGEQADIYYEKITQITDALRINKQIFMENAAMAGSMLIGFEVDPADAREMGLGYTELAYDIWAAFNNVYETLDGADGAMAAVRSAIAGEVEPIRRAGFTIVDSQLAITAANHGLEYSSYSATEAQKSYLRYLTLVDQAMNKGIIGTYASEMQTAEGMMRTFSQQLKSLSQAFGSLFLPILVKVMPYLQAFVELLTEGVYWLANFFGIDIQPVDFSDYKTGASAIEDVANSAGTATDALDSATKAAKELKHATVGIDELNVISPASNAAGGGGGSGSGGSAGGGSGGFEGLDVSSIWDESILDGISQDVDAIKEKLRGWMPVIATVATALAGLRLAALIKDMQLIGKTGAVFTSVLGAFKGIAEYVKAVKAMAPEVGLLAALFPKISGWFAGLTPVLSSAATAVGTFVSGISAPVWATIAAVIVAIASAAYFLYENWEKVVDVVKRFWNENIVPKLDEIASHFDKMKGSLEPLVPVFDWLKVAFDFVVEEGLKIIEVLGGIVFALLSMPFAAVFQIAIGVIENVVQILSGLIQMTMGFWELLIALFTGGDVEAAWQKLWNGIVDYYKGFLGLIIDPVVDLVTSIIDWFTYLWDELVGHSIVPDTINAIVDWFLGLPGKILDSIGKFVQSIIDKFASLGTSLTNAFSSAWEAVKTWWSQKPALTSYVPSLGDIKTKLSDAWTAAKDWWDKSKAKLATYTPSIGKIWENLKASWENAKTWWSKNRGSLSTYTPSIGKIWENLKSSWETAKTWWSKNRGSLSTYTPSIGKIWEKLKSSWESAKTWWSKNKGTMSYTPSIGSIKDKIVSAWNTAKSWWKNNASLSAKLNVSVPKITVKWDTVSAFGKEFRYPTGFSLKFAANGGIFDQGSLIWAGERGPEVMATAAGGKTGVMNVQQMQDAVYEGVYAAVVAAMKGMGGDGTQSVNVYLDGKQITSAVEQRQHERGASIMGNEVYSY